jgi:aspartate aminotransferase-like enzyme
MKTYRIPMVPGPTAVAPKVLAAYGVNYGSGDLEEEYYQLYADTQARLQAMLQTHNALAIMSGEAMVGLWGALKSCLKPGDRVLSVGTGVFGYGVAEMARSITPEVEVVGFEYDEICDPNRVEEAIVRFRPRMVTAIHCETPSGTLNPVAAIGELVKKHEVPLFYVDAVSSAAGAPLQVDDWRIDLCLVGTQKCLSALPDLGIVSVSEAAWTAAAEVGYQGYDALTPWRTGLADRWLPYTPSWQAMAALHAACERIQTDGLPATLRRHADVAQRCRERARGMGLELYPRREAYCSPTVTALKVPERLGWPELDRRLRADGLVVGGSLDKLAGKVFRIGHMGLQANMQWVEEAMNILQAAIRS